MRDDVADHDDGQRSTDAPGVSRRNFLKVGAAALAAEGLIGGHMAQAEMPTAAPATGPSGKVFAGEVPITLSINGRQRSVTVEPRTTLLSALRDRLDPPITGPKLVCNAGTCGACTVLLDGHTAYACSVMALDAVGRQVTTVEGLGTPEQMSPVQAAFVEKDAMMCGFCTSGFVTTVTAFVRDHKQFTPEELRQGCKGNFCRCGTYPHVFEAAMAAAKA